MELSTDGSSDDGDVTDDASSSDGDAHNSSWRAWRAHDSDFLYHRFPLSQISFITANNVGPHLQSTPESELNARRTLSLTNCTWKL